MVSVLLCFGVLSSANAQSGPVIRFAGFGFISDLGQSGARFPVLCKILGDACNDGRRSDDDLNRRLVKLVGSGQISAVGNAPPYRITTADGDSRGADALVMALAFTNEGVEEQWVAGIRRTTYSLWSQLLVFDFESETLQASYPIRLQYTEQSIPDFSNRERVYREMLFGSSHKATLGQALPAAIEKIRLSRSPQWIEIKAPIHIEDAAARTVPRNQEGADLTEHLAQLLQAELAEKLGLTVLPFVPRVATTRSGSGRTADSHTLGRMRLKLANDAAYRYIELPPAVFEIKLKVNDLRTAREVQGRDTLLGIGAFASFAVHEPASSGDSLPPVFGETRFRNVAVIRLTEGMKVDEWASHRENLFVLVARFVQQVGKPDGDWLASNSAPPGAEARIRALRTRLKLPD